MNVAFIPARGGSKRIPRKNIKLFKGKPIIGYTIEAALQSGCFEQVIVSTDDDEIAAVAESFGAIVPFRRPAEFANDHATTMQVVIHGIDWMLRNGLAPKKMCLMYATAPFITPVLLQESLALLDANPNKHYCFAVTEFAAPIQRGFSISPAGDIEMFQPEHLTTRSQDLIKAYHDAGQFYWGKTDAFLKNLPVFSAHSVPYLLPQHLVQDIDTLDDWQRAEWLFAMQQKEKI
jgi:pseudaminic acid cytidylyltransferase